jgi:hypothetical protein
MTLAGCPSVARRLQMIHASTRSPRDPDQHCGFVDCGIAAHSVGQRMITEFRRIEFRFASSTRIRHVAEIPVSEGLEPTFLIKRS